MKITFALAAAATFGGAAALAQLHITSFDSNGELSWTNAIYRGLYGVESAIAPAGPWNLISTVADLDFAKTNRITFKLPTTNAVAFYRVAWIPPDPNGVWDYRAYDNQGTLVITGQLSLVMLAADPLGCCRVGGSWNLQYAGQTNAPGCLDPLNNQSTTGYLTGTVESHTASLNLYWPTNLIDANIELRGNILGNTYTGTMACSFAGPFTAVRVSSTNLTNNP